MSKYIKLIGIVVVQVFGSTEDERCFNQYIEFIKDKVKNWLTILSVSALVFSHKPYVASSCTSVGLIKK